MSRVRSLCLPAVIKDRVAKSLCSVGLYGAEIGGMSVARMNDVRISARSWRPGGPQAKARTSDAPVVWSSWPMEVLQEIRRLLRTLTPSGSGRGN
eukprot:3138559-Amphidinium_carterae.1